MLDQEARILLDTTEKGVQVGRPRLNTLPYAVGCQGADNISEDGETDPLQWGRARRIGISLMQRHCSFQANRN
jgi:hypothetical protein